MKIAKITVDGVSIRATLLSLITKGLVGATVDLETAGSEWDGLTRTVVFRGNVTRDVLSAGATVTVPAETVSIAGKHLYVGVYGTGAKNNVVIPTLWCDLGLIMDAADPSGDESTEPDPAVWAQIQAQIGDLSKLNTADKETLVAAINEALAKGGGTVDEATVQEIVERYLEENPPAGGKDGKDGVSCTHSWNGTVLSVTSASGTSSADLKGDKGDKGDPGAAGAAGKDGYTPIKGKDYYTDADKTEMVNAVLAALPEAEGVGY